MPFGISIRTNKGMTDLSTVKSFRLLSRGDYELPTSPQFQRTQVLPINNTGDLVGPVMLVAHHRRVPVASGRLYQCSVGLINTDHYWANPANIPGTITVRILGQKPSTSPTDYLHIDLYALQV